MSEFNTVPPGREIEGPARREVVVIKFKANGRGNRFGYSESYLSDVVRRRGGGMAPRFSEEETRAIRFRTVDEAVEYVRGQGWPTDGPGWRLHAAVR